MSLKDAAVALNEASDRDEELAALQRRKTQLQQALVDVNKDIAELNQILGQAKARARQLINQELPP